MILPDKALRAKIGCVTSSRILRPLYGGVSMHPPFVKSLFIALLAGCALAPLASAITIRDDTPDSSYIALGADSAYQSAGFFDDGFGGTLVADPFGLDQFVITSAHLVDQGRIVPGQTTFTIGGNSYSIASVVVAPGYNNLTQQNDLAIVHLTSSVTGVTPVPYYTGAAESGATVTLIGYGYTGTGSGGQVINTGGTRRGANNVIDVLDASTFTGLPSSSYLYDFDQPPPNSGTSFNIGSRTPLALEGLIASGDSGGGDFAVIGGTLYLVGVHSYVANADSAPDSSYSDLGGSTRVSLFSGFIAQNIPEPGSAALLIGGVAVLGGLRRRR